MGQRKPYPSDISREQPFAIVIVGGLITDLLMSIFLLLTLYVWIARGDDVLPAPETEFAME